MDAVENVYEVDDPVEWYNAGMREIEKVATNADEVGALWLDWHMFFIMNSHFVSAKKQNKKRIFNAQGFSVLKGFQNRDTFTPVGNRNFKYLPEDTMHCCLVNRQRIKLYVTEKYISKFLTVCF